MNSFNAVTISGNLPRDAELRYTKSGTASLNFSVGVNRSYKDANGGWTEETSWVDCAMFGGRAEKIAEYLRKGTFVCILGKIRQSRWQTQAGENRSKLEVFVDNIHFENRRNPQEEVETLEVYSEDVPF